MDDRVTMERADDSVVDGPGVITFTEMSTEFNIYNTTRDAAHDMTRHDTT